MCTKLFQLFTQLFGMHLILSQGNDTAAIAAASQFSAQCAFLTGKVDQSIQSGITDTKCLQFFLCFIEHLTQKMLACCFQCCPGPVCQFTNPFEFGLYPFGCRSDQATY